MNGSVFVFSDGTVASTWTFRGWGEEIRDWSAWSKFGEGQGVVIDETDFYCFASNLVEDYFMFAANVRRVLSVRSARLLGEANA